MLESAALERVLKAYEDAELWLMHQIKLMADKKWVGTGRHYRGQLLATQTFMNELRERLNRVHAESVEGIRAAYYEYYTAGGRAALPPEQGFGRGDYTDFRDYSTPVRAVEQLTRETSELLMLTTNTVLRDVDDVYRQILQTSIIRSRIGGTAADVALKDVLNQFADRGVGAFIDKAGRQWSLESYARMALRTGGMRASDQGRWEAFMANGINLVRTSWHRGSSPQCAPYQGKILSLDGQAGDRVIEDRVAGGLVTVHVTATMQEAIQNGYHHPNCRHSDSAYIPGTQVPDYPHADKETIEEEYRAIQDQRKMERHIRRWKRRVQITDGPDNTFAKRRLRYWQARQREHVSENVFLTRRYDRERITRPEPIDKRFKPGKQ